MMKSVPKYNPQQDRGFSLVELLTVVAIIAIVAAIAGIYAKPMFDKYNVESQARQMHADVLQARVRAMEKNRLCWVLVNTTSYTVVEDANDNGSNDDAAVVQRTLKYPVITGGTGTITMDQRGIITTSTNTVQFNNGSGKPDYDCLLMSPTRATIGRSNGTGDGISCVPK